MAGFHAPIAPSSMARTVICNAWIRMAEGLPPEDDADKPEAMEGNAADWVAKQYARGIEVPYGTPTPIPGYPVDYDMIHGARLWARTVRYGSYSGVPVIITRVHPTACWGEPDGASYDGIEQILYVPDYKYGFDVHEPFEHWQCMGYAVGLIDTLNLDDEKTEVVITIVQPRAHHPRGPVREWRVLGSHLRSYATIMRDAAHSALRKPGELMWGKPLQAVAGPHCMTTHCPARHRCPALDAAAGHIAEWTRAAESHHEMPIESLATQLTILNGAKEVIEARRSALATQVEAFIRQKYRVPGFMMEPGQSTMKWKKDVTTEQVVNLGRLNIPPVDMLRTIVDPNSRACAVVTPTQAIKAGLAESLVKLYAEPTPSAMKLVPNDGSDARKAFGGGDPT